MKKLVLSSLLILLLICWNGTAQAGDIQSEDVEARLINLENITEALADVQLGGAFSVNYAYQDWDYYNRAREGDMAFDKLRLAIDGSISDVLISVQYRWYSYMDVIHHGWIGYDFLDSLQVQLGITQVPFGLLPYASHNWWMGLPYYIGLEDDYDMGLKAIWDSGPFDVQLAFFKNADLGDPSNLDRYSFDVVTVGDQTNEEVNQVNARVAYTLEHGDLGSTELGVSGELGQLYNQTTEDDGNHWAAGAHVNGNYGPFNLQLEVAQYEYNPENPEGISDNTVEMGAFAASYPVAAEGTIYVANIAYDLEVDFGPVSGLTFYNDFSFIDKSENGYKDSQINTTGCMIIAGPLCTFVDVIVGRNAIWLGTGSDAMASAASSNNNLHTRVNINVGYYF
ncbi:MAG: porin [Candidatus Auribacterota bacterium]|nr:porin [Candidatus Auribacterota bacterium]